MVVCRPEPQAPAFSVWEIRRIARRTRIFNGGKEIDPHGLQGCERIGFGRWDEGLLCPQRARASRGAPGEWLEKAPLKLRSTGHPKDHRVFGDSCAGHPALKIDEKVYGPDNPATKKIAANLEKIEQAKAAKQH